MTYPQPHEGVQGQDLSASTLLSLDDEAVIVRDIIRAVGMHLAEAVTVGNPAPKVQRMSDRIRRLEPGDLVYENSTAYRSDPEARLKGFGVFLLVRDEWWQTDEEWESEVEECRKAGQDPDVWLGERAVDRAYYIQYGPAPGDVCRWTNCSFTVIPVFDTFAKTAVDHYDRSTAVITRDSLLSSLEDSGFNFKAPPEGSP